MGACRQKPKHQEIVSVNESDIHTDRSYTDFEACHLHQAPASTSPPPCIMHRPTPISIVPKAAQAAAMGRGDQLVT